MQIETRGRRFWNAREPLPELFSKKKLTKQQQKNQKTKITDVEPTE